MPGLWWWNSDSCVGSKWFIRNLWQILRQEFFLLWNIWYFQSFACKTQSVTCRSTKGSMWRIQAIKDVAFSVNLFNWTYLIFCKLIYLNIFHFLYIYLFNLTYFIFCKCIYLIFWVEVLLFQCGQQSFSEERNHPKDIFCPELDKNSCLLWFLWVGQEEEQSCVCSGTLWVRFRCSFFPLCALMLLWLFFCRDSSKEWLLQHSFGIGPRAPFQSASFQSALGAAAKNWIFGWKPVRKWDFKQSESSLGLGLGAERGSF